jgi:aryl-alcohol dehydrogenase-like predicted oxidoreductase
LAAVLSQFGGSLAKAAEQAGEMPKRSLGRTGLKVSQLGLGGFHATWPEKLTEKDSLALMHRAIDLGVNFFDNADCYHAGEAEERMGKALVGRRQRVILMTKVDDRDAKGALETLEVSLKTLRTDYLDVWQCHGVMTLQELDRILEARPKRAFRETRASKTKGLWSEKPPKAWFPDGPLAPGGIAEAAEKAKQQGKIRFFGLTGHLNPTVHREAVKRYPFDTVQMAFNCVDPHFESFYRIALPELVKRGVGILAMKTMAFGHIYKQKVASPEEALRWVWSQPVCVAVSGCENMEFLNHNAYIAKTFIPMPEGEQAALLARTESFKGTQVEVYKTWTTNENRRKPRT